MHVEMMPLDNLRPYPGNPRKIGDAAVKKVAASLREFGWRQPIVTDAARVIVVGHTRFLAAKKLKLAEVPVHVAAELTEAQARAYRIADNRTGSETEFDTELLRTELGQFTEGFDLTTLGFDTKELDDLLQPPDEAPTPRRPNNGLGLPVIQYSLVFESEAQQAIWFDFLRHLKREVAGETVAARLVQFLQDAGHGARP